MCTKMVILFRISVSSYGADSSEQMQAGWNDLKG